MRKSTMDLGRESKLCGKESQQSGAAWRKKERQSFLDEQPIY